MNKLTLIAAAMISATFLMRGINFKIELKDRFLKYDGNYLFILNLEGLRKDKAFLVHVAQGKATLTCIKKAVQKAKQLKKGKIEQEELAEETKVIQCEKQKITIADNIIKIDTAESEARAKDLEVLVLDSKHFTPATSATMGLAKKSSKFTVDIRPGLSLQLSSAKKVKVGKHPKYKLAAGNHLPDGLYNLKLIIPMAKDKSYQFEVKDHNIVKVTGDKTGKLQDHVLVINAGSMCAKRRTKQVGAALGFAIPVTVGTAVPGGTLAYAASRAAIAELAGSIAGSLGFSAGVLGSAALEGIAIAGGAAAIGTEVFIGAGSAIGSTKKVGVEAIFGFREATAQVTNDTGTWLGHKAVKIDYEECRNNEFIVDLSDERIVITGF